MDIYETTDGWMNGSMAGWIMDDGWMDRQMDGWVDDRTMYITQDKNVGCLG